MSLLFCGPYVTEVTRLYFWKFFDQSRCRSKQQEIRHFSCCQSRQQNNLITHDQHGSELLTSTSLSKGLHHDQKRHTIHPSINNPDDRCRRIAHSICYRP
jgi:hypothetical protein